MLSKEKHITDYEKNKNVLSKEKAKVCKLRTFVIGSGMLDSTCQVTKHYVFLKNQEKYSMIRIRKTEASYVCSSFLPFDYFRKKFIC